MALIISRCPCVTSSLQGEQVQPSQYFFLSTMIRFHIFFVVSFDFKTIKTWNKNRTMNPYRKKISSLEKDRQDLQLTIDALQEGTLIHQGPIYL